MLEQFSRELLQLSPRARVLITTRDFTTRPGRKNFVARAATGDWDAVVVITHSAFERLPLRADSHQDYTDSVLAQVCAQLADALEHNGSRGLVKKLEAAVARAEAKLERLLATAAKDDGVCFEETGIDRGPESLTSVVAALGDGASAGTVADAAAARVVVVAVPWARVPEALEELQWSDQIVIDATNDFDPRDLHGRTSSEVVADLVGRSPVVKAANTLAAAVLGADTHEAGGQRVLFLSGDGLDAKAEAGALFQDAGFFAIDLGDLVKGGEMQQVGGPLAGANLIRLPDLT